MKSAEAAVLSRDTALEAAEAAIKAADNKATAAAPVLTEQEKRTSEKQIKFE